MARAKKRSKKIIKIIFPVIILSIISGGAFFYAKNRPQDNNTIESAKEAILSATENIAEKAKERITIPKPSEEDLIRKEKIDTSAWIPYWDEARGFGIYEENSDIIESVSPVWFYANPDGTLTERRPNEFEEKINRVHSAGGEIIPTITNPSAQELSNIINDTNLTNVHIQNIVETAVKYNLDGIDIDYESLLATDKDAFSKFIKILGEELHKNRKLLTIAVLPKSANIIYQFSASRQAQDWEAIGKYVDEFRIMGYDWTHNSTTDPGSISPTYWLKEILEYATETVDSEKIVLGLPLYGYYWKEDGVSALTWEDVIELEGDINLDQNTLEKVIKTETGEAWFQDAETINYRRELARDFGIKGVIYWRLGGEDPSIWNLE